ncbi:MAG: carboxypeptidase regulatory-like domain-containing protein [Acidobacteriota bacterium]|nr:MAG: carboxypeptidase regulatory-like domain-containing protein [Acidobacteriota bacterium]
MRDLKSAISAGFKGFLLLAAAVLFTAGHAAAQAQATAADLSGTVVDPSGAVVAGATITARNAATGISRTVTSDGQGNYQIIGLPPGEYEVSAEAASFSKVVISGVRLTVGQAANLTIPLKIGDQSVVVNVTSDDVQIIETTRTTVANTIDQTRINSLPINERSATGFALTISTVGRDNGRPVGPAPTSGLNIGGQRGRSTLVQVDGADFTDNSINAARSTVSQEAVQEYQVTTNSYMPEFGRATGGIVNVVTKRGTSDFSGNVFGFFRHKTIQARNAFAPVIDGDPNKKPPYTRAQYGLTFGGPLNPGKTFFFGSFEQRRRQESGFFTGDITGGATSSITIGAPFLPVSQTFTNLTAAQVTYIQGALGSANADQISRAIAYAHLASIGGQTSINGGSTLVNFVPGIGVPAGQVVGNRFVLSGAPVPLTKNSAGQFLAFRPLGQLARVFPISESSTFLSFRADHTINADNQLSIRLGFNPSRINGIQDESQNQTLGQNDYSRTGIQRLEDFSFGSSLTSILTPRVINELYYNYGRRVAKFDSQIPSVALQIAGTGFIGSNPFSPVDRVEARHQIRNNMTWATAKHTVKFGADFNWVSGQARFDLNFPGLFNFGQQAAGSLVSVNGVACDSLALTTAGLGRCPALTATQAYGLGFPSVFIQGFGDPNSSLSNKPIAFFIQDTWKIHPRFTINYGVRYDYEFTQEFAPSPFTDPLTGITLTANDVQTAQDALNVTQGFPRDKNNIAPRVGFAWDLAGNGRTVIRGAGGIFYDKPLLTVSFNSNIADGSQQQQATLLPIGGPSPLGLFNAFQVMHGTLIPCNFAGATPGVNCTPGLAPSAQYQQGLMRFNSSLFTGFGPILPFTLHVSKDFEYPMAVQGNLSIEKMIGKSMSLSATYINVTAKHLAHPQDVNNVNSQALVDNFRRFTANNPVACGGPCPAAGRAPTSLTEAAFFSLPTTNSALYTMIVPGFVIRNNTTNQLIVSPIAANFFRKLGPNYFFVRALTGLTKAQFDPLLNGTLRTPGPINPYADVNAQMSDGNSSYNAMNIELKKRFSNGIQFFTTYTWAHSIDDSSDLQTLLKPQDNTNFRAEKSNSLFDQRHRFVMSGVMGAPDSWRGAGGFKSFLHGFSFAPIVEFGSGRPFNILAVGDANGDFQSTNERPSVRADGTLCATGIDTDCQTGIFPANGTLGRNMGITSNYFSVDARVTRRVRFTEKVNLDIIAEGFNLFNRFNEAAGNPFYQVVNAFGKRSGGGKYFSQPTSAFDPRQFQIGLKLSF